MAKRKIKVVRCGKCSKRYGSMKEGQKCPHCARARGSKSKAPRKRNLSLVTADAAIDLIGRARKRGGTVKRHNPRFEKKVYTVWGKQESGNEATFGQVEAWTKGEAKEKAETIKAHWNRRCSEGVCIIKVSVSDTGKVVASQNPKRRTNRIPSRLKGRKLTTLEMVRMLPKKEVARIRRSVEKRKNPKRFDPEQAHKRAVMRAKSLDFKPRGKGSKSLRRIKTQKSRRRIAESKRYPSGIHSTLHIRRAGRLPNNNPTAQHMWKKFHGMPSRGDVAVRASKQFPSKGTWVIGPVNYLKVRQGLKRQTVRFGKNARLIANGKRLFGIANARFKQHRGVNPEVHRIVVDEVGYEKVAPHLNDGYTGLTPWKHKFGEESGRKSLLYIDPEGYAILGGGGAHAKADGIHD